jgi:hypothetical protein
MNTNLSQLKPVALVFHTVRIVVCFIPGSGLEAVVNRSSDYVNPRVEEVLK